MKFRASLGIALGITVAALHITATASANGRFPRAQRVIEHPSDPNRLAIAASYGLLLTSDRGKSWHYLCERGFTLDDFYSGDPLLDFTADGQLFVNVQFKLNKSADNGCHWSASSESKADYIVDHSISKSQPQKIVVLVSKHQEGGAVPALVVSSDYGAKFASLGTPLPADIVYTVDVDPKDPAHIVASGLDDGLGVFLSSPDNGTTWQAYPIPNTGPYDIPYIAAVHPTDPNRIYIRTDAWGQSGGETAKDALLYSNDGGKTWSELFRSQAKMLGFALSPDGSTMLLGYGDPTAALDPTTFPGPLGIFKSPTDTPHFEHIFAGYINCLTWTQNGIYACISPVHHGAELVSLENLDFTKDTACLKPLLQRRDIQGALSCAEGTSSATCASEWPEFCSTLSACPDSPPAEPIDCVKSLPESNPSAGTGGATSTGGTNGGQSASGAGGSPAIAVGGSNSVPTSGGSAALSSGGTKQTADARTQAGGGCSCRVSRENASPWAFLIALGVAVARRRRHHPHSRLL